MVGLATSSAARVDDGGEGDESARARIEACRMCLATGSCATAFDTCSADARCNTFVDCMTGMKCWGVPVQDFSNLPPCIAACQSQAQLMGQLDPAIVLFIPVATCVQETCTSSCLPDAP